MYLFNKFDNMLQIYTIILCVKIIKHGSLKHAISRAKSLMVSAEYHKIIYRFSLLSHMSYEEHFGVTQTLIYQKVEIDVYLVVEASKQASKKGIRTGV